MSLGRKKSWAKGCCFTVLSHVWLFATLRTVAHQAPLSTEFSRQEYCSGLPFPSPGVLPNPGIEPRSALLQADSLPLSPGKLYLNNTGNTLRVDLKVLGKKVCNYVWWWMLTKLTVVHFPECVCVYHIYIKWKLLSHVQLIATPWTTQCTEFL